LRCAVQTETGWAVLGFTVRGDKIVEMDVVVDPERLRRLDLTDLTD
jgi:hypothetical protein